MPSTDALLPKSISKPFNFWQDREIRFDADPYSLRLRPGVEVVYGRFTDVEDTKGNNGQVGTLVVTNLRVIWWSAKRRSLNLSIGLYCIQNVTMQEAASKTLSGTAEALYILGKSAQSRFQFVFTSVRRATGSLARIGSAGAMSKAGGDKDSSSNASPSSPGSPLSSQQQQQQQPPQKKKTASSKFQQQQQQQQQQQAVSEAGNVEVDAGVRALLFAKVQTVWRAYDSTRAHRELRLRTAVALEGNVILLDGESVKSKLTGVSHVARDEGHLGTLVVTNLRVVWFSTQVETLTVSIPYLQFVSIHCKSNKYGTSLIIQTSSYAGGLIFAFRICPAARLETTFHEVASFWAAQRTRPYLGLEPKLEAVQSLTVDDLLAGGDFAPSASREASARGAGGGSEEMLDEGLDDRAARAVGEVVETAPKDAFAAYYADLGQKGVDRRPVFDPSIGLAVEKLRHGVTLQELWAVPLP